MGRIDDDSGQLERVYTTMFDAVTNDCRIESRPAKMVA